MYKVAVIYGGKSKEREVSLKSGQGIARALRDKGCEVTEIDFQTKDFVNELKDIDVVYLALHGKYGEDGRIQGLLDIFEIPYVGSGVLASALAMDKAKAKHFFEKAGIRTAKDMLLIKNLFKNADLVTITSKLSFPIVVKPNHEGSTIGLSIVNDHNELLTAINEAFKYDNQVLLEEYIDGTEVTVAILETSSEITALPIIEIIPNKNKYYDYESKYAPGGSTHVVPARISAKDEELLKKWAISAHEVLGCKTISRVDFIIPKDGSKPVILEVNTLPGMTETSLYPDAAKAAGYSYEDIIFKLVEITINNQRNKTV